VMNADGTNVRMLVDHDFAIPGGGCIEPTWSGDGTRIAFACRDFDEFYETYEVDADGNSAPKRFYDHSSNVVYDMWDLNWSHDSSRIVFSDRNATVIASMLNDGTDYKLHASGALVSNPSWSPTGDSVMFEDGPGPTGIRILVVKPDGSIVPAIPKPPG